MSGLTGAGVFERGVPLVHAPISTWHEHRYVPSLTAPTGERDLVREQIVTLCDVDAGAIDADGGTDTGTYTPDGGACAVPSYRRDAPSRCVSRREKGLGGHRLSTLPLPRRSLAGSTHTGVENSSVLCAIDPRLSLGAADDRPLG